MLSAAIVVGIGCGGGGGGGGGGGALDIGAVCCPGTGAVWYVVGVPFGIGEVMYCGEAGNGGGCWLYIA